MTVYEVMSWATNECIRMKSRKSGVVAVDDIRQSHDVFDVV